MDTRLLGASGVEVGAVGLGCMGMTHAYTTGGRDDAESEAVIRRALDLGVTLIDTADIYGPFSNEQLVGRALAGRRDEAVLATKVGLVQGNPVADGTGFDYVRNGKPQYIRQAIDASLRRLGVEHVDLYQLHRVDPEVPLEETWGAMAEVVAAGKARLIGLSEVTAAQCRTAHAIHPVATVQSELSLWTRDAMDNGVLSWCADNGAGFLPFSPLGRGFLTGALAGVTLDPSDFRTRNPRFSQEAQEANQGIVDAVRAVAERRGATPAQVAIAWTMAQGGHVVPIPGTRRLARIEENAASADVGLSSEDLAELDGLPAAVGSRY
jgi:aryl-alcohol dehydrogenase-like predicted oxidoreductase